MSQPRFQNKRLTVALYLNATLLAAVVCLLLARSNGPSFVPGAFAQNQLPIGGGAGMFIVPGQFASNIFGFYIMDVDAQTVCAYAFEGAGRQLRLVAARSFRNDRKLTNFNTGNPTPEEVGQLVDQAQQGLRAKSAPTVRKFDGPIEKGIRFSRCGAPATEPATSQEFPTMMAKMFYTLDETKAALGKNEEEIKQFAREGRLREFRDGPRLMFKADQVEQLKNELGLGGGGEAPTSASPTPARRSGWSIAAAPAATGISLVDTDMGRSGSTGGMVLKDDTALAADLGMTGSLGGVPSPGRPGSSSPLTGSRAGASGINVFTDSEAGGADPSAQTAINASVQDQVNLEGVGSGSGLLDLTRESDDTSLGAELLDEITPGGSKRGVPGETGAGSGGGTAIGRSAVSPAVGRRGVGEPIYVEASDPMAPAFGGMALAGVIMCLVAAVAVFSAVMNTRPGLLDMLKFPPMYLAGGGIALAIVFFIFGAIIGRAAR